MDRRTLAEMERIRRRADVLLGVADSAPAAEPSDFVGSSESSRLHELGALFELAPLAVEVVTCLLAVEYDPSLRRLIRGFQREAGRPCLEVGTIAELLGLGASRVPQLVSQLAATAPLRAWALVEAEEGAGADVPAVFLRVKLAARVACHLAGEDALLDGMVLHPLAEEVQLPPVREALIERAVRATRHGPVVLQIVGKLHTGRRGTGGVFAHRLGLPLLEVDLRGVGAAALPRRLAEVRREARLSRAVPALVNWETALPRPAAHDDQAAAAPEQTPRALPASLARFFEELDTSVVLVAEAAEPLVGFHAPSVVSVEVPFPTPAERARLFAEAFHRHAAQPAPDVDIETITRRFALDAPHIEAAARMAVDEARVQETETAQVSREAVMAACRQQVKHDLKSLAERVENSHRWEQLVIPVDVYESLQEMIAFVRHAKHVYEDWGFAEKHSLARGVSALFAGPPGTGKTMCASVMARELDMELFRVDLSRVVSKWIGETEKNLGKVFDEAQHSNAIILFDEADSLFAKRTEVKSSVDRYANLEVNFLLQRMESFGGMTILTTNFEDTIDTAFKRRLTFRMRFEKPDVDARVALWDKVFPKSCQLAGDLDMRRLSELFEMSGGNIRNAAVRAAFLAAEDGTPVTMAHCLKAAERESREMGLLIRGSMERPADEEAGEGDESSGNQSAPSRLERNPRLVPVTHPRNR